MDRFYTIYRITGPNGRCYIGLTKFTAEQRFRQHMAFAFRKRGNHPFYDTVLAYGPDAFAVEAIACAVDADSAGVTEQRCIAQVPKPLSLNVSPGGECDAEAASAVFWKAMRADPVAFEGYREHLRAAQKNRVLPPEVWGQISEAAAQWRKDNPREAWRNSYRASRAARRLSTPPSPSGSATWTLKEMLLAKHKRKYPRRSTGTTAMWAARSEEERRDVAARISEGVLRAGTDPEYRERNRQQIGEARAQIDRNVQGPRASAGLRAWWATLKADPERYAEYLATRTASLKRTLKNGS